VLSSKFTHHPKTVSLNGKPPVALYYTAEALEAAREQGIQEGKAIATAEQQKHFEQNQKKTVEMQHQVLDALSVGNAALTQQFCEMLPGLVMEAIRRILATVDFDETLMKNIVGEVLHEVHPGTTGVEISLSEEDMQFFLSAGDDLQQKYPGIHFVADRDMRQGDCMVRSNFGILDGTLATKLDNVEALME
jgi:flagellar biosynthesis/type III secretory pathway protein FliH